MHTKIHKTQPIEHVYKLAICESAYDWTHLKYMSIQHAAFLLKCGLNWKISQTTITDNSYRYKVEQSYRTTDLDAGLVDVCLTSSAVLSQLTENDNFLIQKNSTATLLTSIVDCKLCLTQQHALLL